MCWGSGANQRNPSPLDRSLTGIAESSAITTSGRVQGTAVYRRHGGWEPASPGARIEMVAKYINTAKHPMKVVGHSLRVIVIRINSMVTSEL